ncbi:uncharacterized protein LOC111613142 [Centruroides sculpturatus]|uniref:uncharacterized protein LOC111613142 n=1 Tax=Centruroides sculpturatus TaxID=218467 RepID=UPI000C6E4123|nr:uncharacterized protein LOC111613142 [Centruroides sculpturatus]
MASPHLLNMDRNSHSDNPSNTFMLQTSNTLCILQINLQRSEAASSQTTKMVIEKKADIMAFQEPYLYKGKVALLGKGKIFTGNTNNQPIKTGFQILNNNLNVQLITQGCNQYITTIRVNLGLDNIYIINLYAPPSEDILSPLNDIRDLTNNLPQHPILICGDFNAKSPVWYSPIEDPRGYAVNELMAELDFHSLNTSHLPTFSSTNGKSWIDLCLGNSKLLELDIDCQTQEEISVSDHAYILTKVTGVNPPTNLSIHNITNWDYYQELLKHQWDPTGLSHIDTTTDIDFAVDQLQKAINTAFYHATRVKTNRPSAPWWNRDVEQQRKKELSCHLDKWRCVKQQ